MAFVELTDVDAARGPRPYPRCLECSGLHRIARHAEGPSHHVGASSREDAESDVASDHCLSRLVDRAVASEHQNGIEAATDRIPRQVGCVVPSLGIDDLEL